MNKTFVSGFRAGVEARCLSIPLIFMMLVALQGCSGGSSSQTEPPMVLPTQPSLAIRDRLTIDDLFSEEDPGVVHNDYYQPIGNLTTISNVLCGTLHFDETHMTTDHPDSDWKGGGQTLFPAFALPVVISDGWFIPLMRDLILSGRGGGGDGHSLWNIIANPGQVWEEEGDNGYTRVVFPFTLTDNFVGQARNGLATFVFNSNGVSSAAIQVTQETAPVSEYIRTDFSALVPVTFDPVCPVGAGDSVTQFNIEMASRLPRRAWTELSNAGSTQARSRSGYAATDFSGIALLMDGQLYMQEVATRSGPHPMPEWMRHGVFSVTKTMGLGLSMLYLAGRYGDDIFNELITDHIPGLADHAGWQGVTFHDTLNMVTGTEGAERGNAIGPFIQARTADQKLNALRRLPSMHSAPGMNFEYNSTNSFVLSLALNNYVKEREGSDADYWSMVRKNVLEPLGIFYLPISRSIEADGRLGIPIMGWGSYPDVDAAAKIAQLFQDNGMYDGRYLLSKAKTREAMRRTGQRGYATGNSAEYYLHSVWTVRADTGACTIDVPMMSGMGGNAVMMLPSGLSFIRFMDAGDYEVSDSVQTVEYYRSSCQ